MRRPSSDLEVCRRTLTYQQVERLTDVVDSQLEVPGRGNYPTLKMSVRKLVEAVRRRLDADDMAVNDIRINGGAASYIVIGDDDQVGYLSIYLPGTGIYFQIGNLGVHMAWLLPFSRFWTRVMKIVKNNAKILSICHIFGW